MEARTSGPRYIDWIGHGAASLAPAGVFTGVTAHAFGFRANKDAMQALADRFLNAVSGTKVRYQAPVGQALVSFLDVQQCTSSVDRIGWVPGRESALWVPLLEWDGSILPRPVLWSPYIYIDYTIGMLTGRDVWGWSKVLGQVDVPQGQSHDFTCSTTTFDPMAPQTRGVFGPLFKVAGRAPARLVAGLPDQETALKQFLAKLYDDGSATSLSFQPKLSAVALKQVRDVQDATTACYSAVCDSPVQVTRFGSAGFLAAADYALEISTCDSHRIVHDFLGRAPDAGKTVLPIEWAIRAEVDFQALPGRVLAP